MGESMMIESQVPTWTTEDKRVIPVTEMDSDHLRNAIFYLNKRFGQLSEYYPGQTISEVWPIYDDLRREANKRNLSWM
jgi:hypothetical protein